jgi:pullulanase/glycogen debranching enzyme
MYNRGGYVYQKSDSSGYVFLEEDWNGERLPNDLIEEAGLAFHKLSLLDSRNRALIGGYSKEGNDLCFKFSKCSNPTDSEQNLKYYFASNINGWTDAIGDPSWLLESTNRNKSMQQFKMDWNEANQIGQFSFKFVSENGDWIEPENFFPSSEENIFGSRNFLFSPKRTGKDVFSFEIARGPGMQNLDKWIHFSPDGKFGYSQTRTGSRFRVFAPRLKSVALIVFSGTTNEKTNNYPMHLQKDGSWIIDLPFSCEGKKYKYLVEKIISTNSPVSFFSEIIDPYAPTITSRDGHGIAITVEKNSQKTEFRPPSIEKLVILETHIRDLLHNAPISLDKNQRLEFNGLTKWLKSDNCYIKKLGINAVELQPILEFDARSKNEYHWGYMPVNLFAPASVYSSNESNGSSISEFKELINAFHDAEIAVIIDVVYNHFGVPNHLAILDRELYLSVDKDGNLTNHSGCGNDINPMSGASKKIILDSLKFLIEFYSVDGFRFDLGELLGFELLNEIQNELLEEFPDTILIAEPWSFRGRLTENMNQTKFSLWSDSCREELFKFVSGNGNQQAIEDLLTGKLDGNNLHPWQSVNYLESHDDYTFIDRLCSPDDWNNDNPPIDAYKKAKLAIAILLLSPGIPMLASGQDLIRSKKRIRNTYQREDLNALNYDLSDSAESFHQWTKSLVSFRLSKEGKNFCLKEFLHDTQYEVFKGVKDCFALLIYNQPNIKSGDALIIIINATKSESFIDFPANIKNSGVEKILGEECSELGNIPPLSLQIWKTV